MSDTSRFHFHSHAAALSGRIVRVGEGKSARLVKNSFIDLPAAALPAAGGRSSAQLTRKLLKDAFVKSFVRFDSATVTSEGVFDDAQGHFEATMGRRAAGSLEPRTTVRADIRGLDIGLKGHVHMLIRRVRGGFSSKKGVNPGETAIALDKDTGFDGNTVKFVNADGKAYTLAVAVDRDVFQKHHTLSALRSAPAAPVLRAGDDGTSHGTIVKPVAWKGREFPGSTVEPDGGVSIPGFGRVFFGEIAVSPTSRRLTMVRVNLGSPVGGDVAAADVMDNGSWSG
jgi:hypothetical protein